MDDLRHEVTAAFDQDQTALGDLSGVRERIVRSALAKRGPVAKNRMGLAAGLAAVLIAAVVIAGFAYVRLNSHPIPEGPPRPSPSPTPLGQPLIVPDSTPVILYDDPAKSDQIDAMTWDGMRSGTADWASGLGLANHSANRFGSATQITDRAGQVLGTGHFGAKGFAGTWADDGLHFCLMVPIDFLGAGGVPGTLQLVTPGSAPKVIAQVGRVYEQAALFVAACSVRHDRAIVVQTYGNSPAAAQYWVVQLSNRKVLWTRRFDISNPVTVVVSPQAQYIAENKNAGSGSATIFGIDGSHLADLPETVEGFSWDGSIAVTDYTFGSGHVSAVFWGSGNVIWTTPASYHVLRVEPQPDGSSLAVWVITLVDRSNGASPIQSDLHVIGQDGSVLAHIRYPPA